MPGNKSIKPDFNAEYDKSDLLKPPKLVVSFGKRSTLLYDNEANNEIYNRIFKETKRIIRTAILTSSKEAVKKLPQEELSKIRATRGVSFIFNMPLKIEAVYKLMNISNAADIGVKDIDGIIVSQSLNKVYLQDNAQNVLFELSASGIQNNLNFIISNLEKQPTVSCLFLDRFQSKFYGKNAVVPTKIGEKGLPVLSGVKELEAKEGIPDSIAAFFNDEISSLSIIKNIDGTLVYTDREDQVVKLYTNGMLEYVNYNLQSTVSSPINVSSAIDISTDFVSKHLEFPMEFPKNSYISDIIKTMNGDRYIIRYRYTYEGLPIILDSGLSSDTIEVEIVGDEVRRYKRVVREFNDELEYKQVMEFRDVLDIILDEKVEVQSGEKIIKVKDMYLAYYENYSKDNINYIPVWVAEVTVKRTETGTVLNQRYIINAEIGVILDK